MNKQLLNEKIKASKLSISDFLEKTGLDRATFYRKMKSDGIKFSLGEIHRIMEVLGISKEEAMNIFLPTKSHKRDKEVSG